MTAMPLGFDEGVSGFDLRKHIDAAPAHRASNREEVTVARSIQPPWRTARPTRAAGFTLVFLLLAGCASDDESPSPNLPPSDVVTLSVLVVSPTEVALSWTNPSTQYAQPPRDLYSMVRRDGTAIATTHEFAFFDRNVAPDTQYCYEVVVEGVYLTFLGGYITYAWGSGKVCVVTHGP